MSLARRTAFVTSFLVVSALAAFLSGSSAHAKRAAKGKAPAAPTADCKTDADCVAVVDECCPCSQGGKQRAIPKKEQATYEKDRRKRCAETVCTEMMSTDPTCSQKPFCGAGICELAD